MASHELLKNYIMRYIQPVELRDEAKTKWRIWKESLDHPLISLYGTMQFIVMETYEINIIHHTKLFKKTVRGKQVADLYNDIKLKSEYYEKLIHPSNGREGNCSSTELDF